MDDLVLRASFGDDREIWISDVSRDTFDANEIEDLGTDFGYFVMTGHRSPGGRGARILAKAASAEAALELFGILTSRSKRCAVLTEQNQETSDGDVAYFRQKHESQAPAAGAKQQRAKATSANAPSISAKQDGPRPTKVRASQARRCLGDYGPPSKPRARRKRVGAAR